MYFLPLTLPTPAENVALDEALLDACEAGEIAGNVLRVWESPEVYVVLGRSTDPKAEVNLAACQREGVPVFRRPSGGCTVVAGPGCLMYAVVLDFQTHPQLRAIDAAHRFVLNRFVEALAPLVQGVAIAGISDLAVPSFPANEAESSPGEGFKKISGNALRLKRNHLLYHGTLLYDFPLELFGRLLAMPARQPNYRYDRSHAEFVTNLPLKRDELETSLVKIWGAHKQLTNWPQERLAQLVAEKYTSHPSP